jgi:hypothetical protein
LKYINELIAQGNKIKKVLFEIAIYSNGSVTLQDLYNLPLNEIKDIETTIEQKIKLDKNIKEKQLL